MDTADYMHLADPFLLGQTPQSVADRDPQRIIDILLVLPVLLATFFLALPIFLWLLVSRRGVFERVERQFYRPMPSGKRESVSISLLHFNVKKEQGRYNWLRRFEVYRWPELWNLLKGDLTFVGVRPLASADIEKLDEHWQQPRHEQRPGFTGLWYLNTRPDGDLTDSVIADIYYLATRNWREDLRILWQTPISWIKRIRN
jgi:lipopolysaccharide/colanic/teichoic acid biosynthesis glycosyltransferase